MLGDFVLETTSAPGTSTTITLAGAAPGPFCRFRDQFSSGDPVYFTITDNAAQSQAFRGTLTTGTPDTLSVLETFKSNAGTTTRLNFTGTCYVSNFIPGSKAIYRDGSGDIWLTGSVSKANPIVANNPGMGYSQSTQTLSIYSGTCALNLAGTFNTEPVTQYFFNQTLVGSVSITPTTTSFNTTSDYRLKVTFGRANVGAMIDAVPVHDAAFKADLSIRRPMFLAHELQAAAPWAVRGDKDAIDENGQIIPQQVDHSSLVAAMWAEIQSLRRRVAQLETKA